MQEAATELDISQELFGNMQHEPYFQLLVLTCRDSNKAWGHNMVQFLLPTTMALRGAFE